MTEGAQSELDRVRYSVEARALTGIRADPDLKKRIEWARRTFGLDAHRQHLLSNAVRVNERILPKLARSFRDVSQRSRINRPLEAFVVASADLNAAVIAGQERFTVVMTSTSVERLEPEELDFIIGHELGHAAYGHLDVPATAIVARGEDLPPPQAMRLMAWLRLAEISADRAGLLCCGSMPVAAMAMFKSMSGLTALDRAIDPSDFASQWDDLAEELTRDAHSDRWMTTHPFPPLRMRALVAFSQTPEAGGPIGTGQASRPLDAVDAEIERMLAMIDPLARRSSAEGGAADPLLQDFFLWGGLYVAAADGHIDPRELDNLASLVGPKAVAAAQAEGMQTPEVYRERFARARQRRTKPLTALELQRIFTALAALAKADGLVAEDEMRALRDLAEAVGISAGFVRTLFEHG